jgi:hypothetical protein
MKRRKKDQTIWSEKHGIHFSKIAWKMQGKYILFFPGDPPGIDFHYLLITKNIVRYDIFTTPHHGELQAKAIQKR